MKRIAWITFIISATLTMAFLFWEFRSAVVLFILSLAVAATVQPMVEWISTRGMTRGLALLITYGLCLGSILVLLFILTGPLLADLKQLTTELMNSYQKIQSTWPAGNLLQRSIVQQLPATADLSRVVSGPQGFSLLQTMVTITLSSFDVFSQVAVVLVLSVYWSADQEHFKRLWLSLLPFDMRVRARETWQNIETGFGAYLRSEIIQCMLAVILLGIGFQIMGIKYPIALAVIGAIAWLIPWVGVVLAVVPVILVGSSIGLWLGLLATCFTIGVLTFLEFVVEPRLFNRERFSSLLAVVVMLILVDEFGLLAILAAPPLAAAIQIVGGQVIWLTTIPSGVLPARPLGSAQPLSALKDRLANIQTMISEQPEPVPELANLVGRLTGLIDQAAEGHKLAEATPPPGQPRLRLNYKPLRGQSRVLFLYWINVI